MYEYRVIEAPAPAATGWLGRRKTTYAQTLSDVMNEMALDNWEFQRTEQGPKRSSPDLLVFRRAVAKADKDMDAPKSFAERMNEAEHHPDESRSYEGPVRPRRARIVGDTGPMTERPKQLSMRAGEPDFIDGTARRVTPMKPQGSGSASAAASAG